MYWEGYGQAIDDLLSSVEWDLVEVETDFSMSTLDLMETGGITRSDLAKRLDSSRAYVTKVLRGNVNLTLKSMVKIARALDSKVEISLKSNASTISSMDYFRKTRKPRLKSIPFSAPAIQCAVDVSSFHRVDPNEVELAAS